MKIRKKLYKPIPSEDINHSKNINKKKFFKLKNLKKWKFIKKNTTLNYILLFSFSFLCIFIILLIIINFKPKKRKISYVNIELNNETFREKSITQSDDNNKKVNMSLIEEIKESQQFIDMCMNDTLINQNIEFYKSENPKISVVVPLFNAEGYIKYNLCSIQKQNFHDIEIIIVDDYSKDNSVNLVKDLMKKDPRIILYQNEENKGTLYSKTKGVLMAKGKYVLVSDQDDMYIQNDAFSTMYKELEKYSLDILGFGSIYAATIHLLKRMALYLYLDTPVMYQPHISRKMFYTNKQGNVVRIGDVIWNYIYKTEVFIKSIMQIDDKYMNSKMNCHEDFLLFFLLTRNAYNLKHIKRLFYAHIKWVGDNDTKILFTKKEKKINKQNLDCMSFMNYIEFLLMKTKDTIDDKKIASSELKNWYLNNPCKNNTYVEERGRKVCKLFLENKYITDDVKKEINSFLEKKS